VRWPGIILGPCLLGAITLAFLSCDDPLTPGGILQVTTATGGTQQDEDGYRLLIDSAFAAELPLDGVVELPLSEGLHRVQLTEMASTCAVDGDNPATSFVGRDTMRALTFRVECGPGTLSVTTATGGTGSDPDGYLLLVDDVQVAAPEAAATVSVTLEPGPHSVRLSGLAPECTTSGSNPRTVTVARNRTASTTFNVTCTTPPAG
jgi:hypothetical protein